MFWKNHAACLAPRRPAFGVHALACFPAPDTLKGGHPTVDPWAFDPVPASHRCGSGHSASSPTACLSAAGRRPSSPVLGQPPFVGRRWVRILGWSRPRVRLSSPRVRARGAKLLQKARQVWQCSRPNLPCGPNNGGCSPRIRRWLPIIGQCFWVVRRSASPSFQRSPKPPRVERGRLHPGTVPFERADGSSR